MTATAIAERQENVPALRIVAAPLPLGSDFARLADIEQSAYALFRHIVEYRAVPFHPENADYRARRLAIIEADVADLRRAMGNG